MEAQISAICQFCETSTEIKCKCINCDLFLCRICNSRIHSKIKSATEHKVISLEECGSESTLNEIRKLDLDAMKCQQHNSKSCFLYCNNCSLAVCSSCIKEIHQDHKLCELDKVYDEKYAELRSLHEKIQTDISFWEREEQKLIKLKSEGEDNYLETKSELLKLQNVLEQEVTNKSDRLIEEVENDCRSIQKELERKMEIVTEQKKDLEDNDKNLLKSLKSRDASEIFAASSMLSREMPIEHLCQIQAEPFHFIAGKISMNDIGVLHRTENFEVLDTFKSSLQSISKIVCGQNECILYCEYDEKLQKVKFENGDVVIEKEIKTKDFTDMALTKDGQILLLIGENVTLLDKSDFHFKLKSPDPYTEIMYTKCIHINPQNEFMIAAQICICGFYPDEEFSSGVIYTYPEDVSKCFQCYDKYKMKEDLIDFSPNKLLSTESDELIIMSEDFVLKCTYENFKPVWTYNGCGCQPNFCPTDMAESLSGLIFITSYSNDVTSSIHVLNQNGEMLTCNLLYKKDISLAMSLTFDECGTLWIGCHKTDYEDDPKIYCLKFNNVERQKVSNNNEL